MIFARACLKRDDSRGLDFRPLHGYSNRYARNWIRAAQPMPYQGTAPQPVPIQQPAEQPMPIVNAAAAPHQAFEIQQTTNTIHLPDDDPYEAFRNKDSTVPNPGYSGD